MESSHQKSTSIRRQLSRKVQPAPNQSDQTNSNETDAADEQESKPRLAVVPWGGGARSANRTREKDLETERAVTELPTPLSRLAEARRTGALGSPAPTRTPSPTRTPASARLLVAGRTRVAAENYGRATAIDSANGSISLPPSSPPPLLLVDEFSIRSNSETAPPFELADILTRKWLIRNSGFLVSLAFHTIIFIVISLLFVSVGTGRAMIALELFISPELENIEGPEEEVQIEVGENDDSDELSLASLDIIDDSMGDNDGDGETLSDSGEISAMEGLRNAGGGDGKSAKFFGMKSQGNSFVYVLDCSGSMDASTMYARNRGRAGVTRFDVARSELLRSVESLQSHQEFYAVLFSAKMHRMFDDKSVFASPIKATPENKERFKKWLVRTRIDGGTDPRESLALALRMRPDSIFMLSDGEFVGERNDDQPKAIDIATRFVEDETKISINAIAFEDERSEDSMKSLASVSGGDYRFVTIDDSIDGLLNSSDLGFRMKAIHHLVENKFIKWNQRFEVATQKLVPILCDSRPSLRKQAEALLNTISFEVFVNRIGSVASAGAKPEQLEKAKQQWMQAFVETNELMPYKELVRNPFLDQAGPADSKYTLFAMLATYNPREVVVHLQQLDLKQLEPPEWVAIATKAVDSHLADGRKDSKELLAEVFSLLNEPCGGTFSAKRFMEQGNADVYGRFSQIMKRRRLAAWNLGRKLKKAESAEEKIKIEEEIVSLFPETKEGKAIFAKRSSDVHVSAGANNGQ